MPLPDYTKTTLLALGYSKDCISQYETMKDKYDTLYEMEYIDEVIRYYTQKKEILKTEQKLKQLQEEYKNYRQNFIDNMNPSFTKTECLKKKHAKCKYTLEKLNRLYSTNLSFHSKNDINIRRFMQFCKDFNIVLSEDPKE
jgi:hypothetical protein